MSEISLKYKNDIIDLVHPDSWNELTQKQLLYVAENWQKWKRLASEGKSMIIPKCQLFLRLISGGSRGQKNQIIPNLHHEDVYEMAQLTNFIFEKNTLTICPVPVIKYWFKKLYPPTDRLSNILFLEFASVDLYFLKYWNEDKIGHLNKMIACLYRPKLKGSSERILFNKNNDSIYLRAAKSLSNAEKQAIFLWYHGCRELMIKTHPDIFTPGNQTQGKSRGWIPVILALAGDKFGPFQQTEMTDFHLILMELTEMKNRNPKTP